MRIFKTQIKIVSLIKSVQYLNIICRRKSKPLQAGSDLLSSQRSPMSPANLYSIGQNPYGVLWAARELSHLYVCSISVFFHWTNLPPIFLTYGACPRLCHLSITSPSSTLSLFLPHLPHLTHLFSFPQQLAHSRFTIQNYKWVTVYFKIIIQKIF